MKWFFSLFFLTLVLSAQAQVSLEHVSMMLDQMVRENVISAEEALRTKVRLKNMNQAEWVAMREQATQIAASRGPASLSPIEEAKVSDLDKQQFKQIQNDIKKIMPNYGR